MITLSHIKSDTINRMITLTGEFYLVRYSLWDSYNRIQRLITLTSDNIKRLSLYYEKEKNYV
jgi:hypothetical protein